MQYVSMAMYRWPVHIAEKKNHELLFNSNRLSIFFCLLLQDHLLPPSLSKQMAVRGDGAREHTHRQHRVLHFVRIRHHVE